MLTKPYSFEGPWSSTCRGSLPVQSTQGRLQGLQPSHRMEQFPHTSRWQKAVKNHSPHPVLLGTVQVRQSGVKHVIRCHHISSDLPARTLSWCDGTTAYQLVHQLGHRNCRINTKTHHLKCWWKVFSNSFTHIHKTLSVRTELNSTN